MTNLLLALTFISIIAAIVAIMKANRLGDMYDKLSANLRMSQHTGDNFIVVTNRQINDIKNNLIEKSRIAKLEDKHNTLANNMHVMRRDMSAEKDRNFNIQNDIINSMNDSFENVTKDVLALDKKIEDDKKIMEDTKARCMHIVERLNKMDQGLRIDLNDINTAIDRLEEYLNIETICVPGKKFYAKRKKKK